MKKSHRWLLATALCFGAGGTGANIAFAGEIGPQNQREFDAFARESSAAQLDAAGKAFGNSRARLFWFTDLESAKKQAKIENKPILSLRLLGNLTDEYSCANSRFFRVIFYPQSQINPQLRDKFILHWSSERAVPVVTIDMGDGRVIKRTLTGNSAHYLLDETGRPLDAMPGLVTPARFAKWLDGGAQLHRNWAQTGAENREALLNDWHRAKIGEIWREIEPKRAENAGWVTTQIENSLALNPLETVAASRVGAEIAAPLAIAKSRGEIPILDATRLFGSGARIASSPFSWGILGATNAVLDEATKMHIKATNPPLENNLPERPQIQTIALQKPASDAFASLISRFETSILADDRLSLERFQLPIHASFVSGKAPDFPTLNRKIYNRLFLTPRSDAWLGLSPAGAFTGLQNGGLMEKPTRQ